MKVIAEPQEILFFKAWNVKTRPILKKNYFLRSSPIGHLRYKKNKWREALYPQEIDLGIYPWGQ